MLNSAGAAEWKIITTQSRVDKSQWATVSNNSVSPTSVIDISTGTMYDDTRTFIMNGTIAAGKDITLPWAEGGTPGTPLGGRASGAPALAANQTWFFI